jgi:hypothetical protein
MTGLIAQLGAFKSLRAVTALATLAVFARRRMRQT